MSVKRGVREIREISSAKERIPWNKGKAGMDIYSEEALAKMLKGTFRSNIKSVRRKKVKQVVRKVIGVFKRIKIEVIKPIIKAHRRYTKDRQKREHARERKRRLIERHIYQDKKWLRAKYLKAKLSTVDIAQLCGVSRYAVCKALNKYDIERRSLREAWKLRKRKDININ